MDKLVLITRNTQEIVSMEELKDLIKTKKQPIAYLGTALTGKPHIGYFPWVLKLSDLLKANFKVKLLLADLHGALDGTPWDILDKRYEYYKAVIEIMFKCIGVDTKNFEIVKGSDYQLKKDYILDTLKLSTMTSMNDAKRAAASVVKFGDNPKLAGLIYPLMQALDEVYLEADIQIGGVDQRKIMMLARENLPKLNQKPRIEMMLPMIPGLQGSKMSASDPNSKIDLLDDETTIKNKMKKAYCLPGEIKDNGILAFTKHILFQINDTFTIERPEKFGGNLTFNSYQKLEDQYKEQKIHPLDLKNAVAKGISNLLKPFEEHKKTIENIAKQAYPNK